MPTRSACLDSRNPPAQARCGGREGALPGFTILMSGRPRQIRWAASRRSSPLREPPPERQMCSSNPSRANGGDSSALRSPTLCAKHVSRSSGSRLRFMTSPECEVPLRRRCGSPTPTKFFRSQSGIRAAALRRQSCLRASVRSQRSLSSCCSARPSSQYSLFFLRSRHTYSRTAACLLRGRSLCWSWLPAMEHSQLSCSVPVCMFPTRGEQSSEPERPSTMCALSHGELAASRSRGRSYIPSVAERLCYPARYAAVIPPLVPPRPARCGSVVFNSSNVR
jgi:hypothetical protein